VTQVTVRVRIPEGTPDDIRSLHTWLRDEPAIRAHGQPALTGLSERGEMSTGLEVLSLVLGTGLSAAQLALSIIMWRATRNHPVRVVIERDERQVAVDTSSPEQAEAIAAGLEAS
jgi:Effector Associated Constant Component 1